MGNPHCLAVVDDIEDDRIPAMGSWLQANEAFSDGVNAGFAQVLGRDTIRLRVVERGAGETLACGTGACASVVILHRWGLVDDSVNVHLPGGHLVIKWRGSGEAPLMKGPAKYVFRGIMDE
jgi:diaminopimelate epimerase